MPRARDDERSSAQKAREVPSLTATSTWDLHNASHEP